jgi:hypothetical protein
MSPHTAQTEMLRERLLHRQDASQASVRPASASLPQRRPLVVQVRAGGSDSSARGVGGALAGIAASAMSLLSSAAARVEEMFDGQGAELPQPTTQLEPAIVKRPAGAGAARGDDGSKTAAPATPSPGGWCRAARAERRQRHLHQAAAASAGPVLRPCSRVPRDGSALLNGKQGGDQGHGARNIRQCLGRPVGYRPACAEFIAAAATAAAPSLLPRTHAVRRLQPSTLKFQLIWCCSVRAAAPFRSCCWFSRY